MIRRKVRPLAAFAAIAVFLLFHFLRNSGTEIFTFDSLPPYTDTDTYVKKPTPIPVAPQEPPPPPLNWRGTQPNVPSSVQENPPPRPEREAEDKRPLRQVPHGQDRTHSQQSDNDVSTGRTQHQHQEDPPHGGDHTTFEQFRGTGGELHRHEGHTHTITDQPPVTGDLPEDRFAARPYTAEELAPRIEQYPLSPAEIIHLPRGQARRLPTIQARFPTESAEQRRVRLQRQTAIKRAMTRSWDAYATFAMGHDEVRPVSGRYNDPFCGWGATLVDSLDTLQIMGMDTEYREALAHLERIDFAHTRSRSIPLFETVIRYLGGLLGAYDISGGKDNILLDKAKDLGDMLMGAFDTHNRMPLLRYDWRPQSQRYGLRASQSSCLAELGTLSLEFTRLAQLTGNHSYYDAVQRITDGFEGFQYSHVPGLLPLHIDASGCEPVVHDSNPYRQIVVENSPSEEPPVESPHQENAPPAENSHPEGSSHASHQQAAPHDNAGNGHLPHDNEVIGDTRVRHNKRQDLEDTSRAEMSNEMRQSLNAEGSARGGSRHSQAETIRNCVPQGLVPSIWYNAQDFSFGGEADSTYEYFLKEYILLGGRREQYKNLYVNSVEAAEKYLFFRPLVEGDPEIMFSGKYRSHYDDNGTATVGALVGEMQHLTCFVGGMLAMGSKIFRRPHDLFLAERITDGCVWAYNHTATGIMPETFTVQVCDEEPCHWTPRSDPERRGRRPDDLPTLDPIPQEDLGREKPLPHGHGERPLPQINKRQLDRSEQPRQDHHPQQHHDRPQTNDNPRRQGQGANPGPPVQEWPTPEDLVESAELMHSSAANEVNPEVERLAVERQQSNRDAEQKKKNPKPLDMNENMDTRYILRPEAIESVFYMWRITGDRTWQDKGWWMWESIEKATWTDLAYSAIQDVNDIEDPMRADSMESFWLAETLKYFYLLYSEPDLVSLDEWVFNTEAHPFRRTKAGAR